LIVLIKHANNETGECWPSIDLIAQKVRKNRKTVMAATASLEKKKFIERRRGNRDQGTIYRVLVDIPKVGTTKDGLEVPKSGTTKRPASESSSPKIADPVVPKPKTQKSQNRGFALYKNSLKNSLKKNTTCCASSTATPAPHLLKNELIKWLLGELGYTANITKPQRAEAGGIASQLITLDCQTVQEARRRWSWVRETYSDATPYALPKHWTAAGRSISDELTPIPDRIDTPKFAAIWRRWLVYHRQHGQPLIRRSIEGQLARLADMGERKACQLIKEAIDAGRMGLFTARQTRDRYEAVRVDDALPDGLLRFVEQVGHVADKRGGEKAEAEAQCRETAKRLADLGCMSAKDARERWRQLNAADIDAELSIHNLADRWHELTDDALERAVAACYDPDTLSRNPQIQSRVSEIAQQLAELGADADEVPRRWAWMRHNEPTITVPKLALHWDQAGEHIAAGSNPGRRPNAQGWPAPSREEANA
jgi:hypothetical protein